MSENKNDINETENDPVHRIPLKRHLWPDEVALKEEKAKVKKWKRLCVVFAAAALIIGWLGGSLLPFMYTQQIRDGIRSALGISTTDKLSAVLEIMETSWYFGEDIDDLEERLIDQALAGITTNDEDPHTEYMSAEEDESFFQSINRNYVGIGAQYIMYNDMPIVTTVFQDTPAEEGGLQAGDIITEVDGTSTDGMTSSEVKSAIQGEEGTDVVLTVLRDEEEISITLTRGAVSATMYGERIDDDTLYLQLYQFGSTTAEDVADFLDEEITDGEKVSLVLDLRDNGGGYLTSVQALASYFLEEGDTIMTQEFTDGTVSEVTAGDGLYDEIENIVILVNENTASASEVMTLALKQNRDDVTVVGETTYGKGTVQTTAQFSDGSALKYTTSRWLSPDGDWINDVGITPDEEVTLPSAVDMTYPSIDEDASYGYDDVDETIAAVQLVLQLFGYDVDRTDGYFSAKTVEAWTQFQEDHGMTADGTLTQSSYLAAVSEVIYAWATTHDYDTQYARALEILNG